MRKPRARGWFKKVVAEFSVVAARFEDKPFTYVEVGCWAGNSIRWMLDNIMTNSESRGHGIDPYLLDKKHTQEDDNDKKRKAFDVTKEAYEAGRWTWHYEDSKVVLPSFTDPIDLLYLDGLHNGWDVLTDFVLAWKNLKPGSVVIFDDLSPAITKTRSTPHVKEAFEAIKIAWGNKIKVLHYGPKQASLEVVSK